MIYVNPQIIATIGPASESHDVLKAMIDHHADVIRFNFSWSDQATHQKHLALIRTLEQECDHRIITIADLPGPRIQEGNVHEYNTKAVSAITGADTGSIAFALKQGFDYIAVSFVGGPSDILTCKKIISENGGTARVIAKIERAVALESLDAIIAVADAIMIARGDLGNEISLERIPFVQAKIIRACNVAGKPVITATQMLLSMTDNPLPERAEVTDVANAILQGSDAVMLSEESATGKYPVESVAMMERIILESEHHMSARTVYPL
jgi:pyruvate kinase